MARHPGRMKALQAEYQKRRAKRVRSAADRRKRNLADARRRAAAGVRPALHQAHVRAWLASRVLAIKGAALHDQHVRVFFSCDSRKYAWRYRHDVSFRLKELLRRQLRKKIDSKDRVAELIRSALRRSGDSPTIQALLGWSIADLAVSLERQLPAGVSLRTMAVLGYHIDHIIPKRCFDLTTVEGVREYWGLWNLRPLPGMENLRKHDRLEVDLVL